MGVRLGVRNDWLRGERLPEKRFYRLKTTETRLGTVHMGKKPSDDPRRLTLNARIGPNPSRHLNAEASAAVKAMPGGAEGGGSRARAPSAFE